MNFFYECMGCMKTVDEYANIRYKEYEMEERKKKFGLAYMKIVMEATKKGVEADAAELKGLEHACVKDLEVLEGEIKALKEEIDRVKNETEAKKVKPGNSGAAGTTSGTTAAASTTPAETTTTTTTPAPATTNTTTVVNAQTGATTTTEVAGNTTTTTTTTLPTTITKEDDSEDVPVSTAPPSNMYTPAAPAPAPFVPGGSS